MEMENFILDFKDELNKELNITANFYINQAILMAQRCLLFSVGKTSINDGIIGYRVYIEQIETFARAAEKLPDNYDNDMQEFEKNLKEEGVIKIAKIANKKLELIMKKIFKSSPQKAIIKLSK